MDWTGDPAQLINPDTSEIIESWIFVGVLTYSQYAFVRAYPDQKADNWIKSHVQMFEFFGGVTPMLIPDNCSTAVNHSKSDRYTVELNTAYHEMAEHYNVAIIPARFGNLKINQMQKVPLVRSPHGSQRLFAMTSFSLSQN